MVRNSLYKGGLPWPLGRLSVPWWRHPSRTPAPDRRNREAAKSIVAEWVAGLDDAFLSTPYSPEYAKGLQPVSHVFAAATRFLVLRKRLIAAVSNADAQLKMRGDPGVIVPYLRVPPKAD